MGYELAKYDAMCRAIEAAHQVDEVKDIRDKALALEAYAQQARNTEAEWRAAEIRLRAERKAGQLLAEMKRTGERDAGEGGDRKSRSQADTVKLSDIGISKNQSSRWQKLGALADDKFEAALGKGKPTTAGLLAELLAVNHLVREANREERLGELARASTPTMNGFRQFAVIYADPPWRYETIIDERNAIENHYPTMPLEEICALPVTDLALPDCVLFLWTPSAILAQAISVIDRWGFAYRSHAIWDKGSIGLGVWFRQQHETLLVAAKGNIPAPLPACRVSSVIRAPRAGHSVKPDVVYEIIEAMYPGLPKLELFQRRPREGWRGWGKEVDAIAA
ncbi:MAG: MT-A70 family methyltransferase [Candidatus Binataceae bacterium]|jgi:N6-adenosine-specific RNA methylase IME4